MTGETRTRTSESERLLGEISDKISAFLLQIETVTSVLKELEKHSTESKQLGEFVINELKNISEKFQNIDKQQ